MAYVLVWTFYWRLYSKLPVQVHLIQFLLVLIAAGLAFEVGRQIGQVTDLLKGLSKRTYPNRTLDLSAAEDRISAELTRSRRYQHPLSVLVVQMNSYARSKLEEHPNLQRDILAQFASAKVGQIINERARETDLIMRDEQGRFVRAKRADLVRVHDVAEMLQVVQVADALREKRGESVRG